jgi:hypothetical protein
VNLNGIFDSFQRGTRETAGVVQGGRELRMMDDGVDLRRIGPRQLVREKRR